MGAWVVISIVAWLLLAVVGWWAQRTSPRPDLATGLVALAARLYCRVVHGLRVDGTAYRDAALRANADGRAIVIVANHAAGIDPFLVQSAIPKFVRWVVGMDTVVPAAEPFVNFADPVKMHGKGNEMLGVREALRHLAAGGILGLFPEGRIARAEKAVTPFQPGIGLMIGKSRALVLPAVITGVPIRNVAYSSFFAFSRSRVAWQEPIDYASLGTKSGDIAPDLQRRFVTWLGPGASVITPVSATPK